MRDFRKLILTIVCCMPIIISFVVEAQDSKSHTYENLDNPFAPIRVGNKQRSQSYPDYYKNDEYVKNESRKPQSSNPWILYASSGLHTFRGDYSCIGKFSGTISPQWSIGVGKWLVPWIGLKAEFMKSRTDGYTRFYDGHYGYGPDLYTDTGIFYRKMRARWIDVNGSIMLNLSHLFMGYDSNSGYKLMNHIIGGVGIDAVHHLGFENSAGSDNQIAAHVFLQYSRFLNPERTFSADLALGGIFYRVNQDIVDAGASSISCNLGVSIGLTWYIGQKKQDMRRQYSYDYSRDAMRKSIFIDDGNVERNGTTQSISFYVMYPESVDDRNDATLDEYGLADWLIGNNSDPALEINSHSGLSYVYSTFGRKKGETVVSFADMYAAIGNVDVDYFGSADAATVELLNKLLSKGVVTLIEIHRAGDVPNLDDYRTITMAKWLKSHPMFSGTNTIVYVDNNFLPQSVRNPEKVNLNRCVKVKLQVVY